jgi:hypothetical protein
VPRLRATSDRILRRSSSSVLMAPRWPPPHPPPPHPTRHLPTPSEPPRGFMVSREGICAQTRLEVSPTTYLSGGMQRRGWGFCPASHPSTYTYSVGRFWLPGPEFFLQAHEPLTYLV